MNSVRRWRMAAAVCGSTWWDSLATAQRTAAGVEHTIKHTARATGPADGLQHRNVHFSGSSHELHAAISIGARRPRMRKPARSPAPVQLASISANNSFSLRLGSNSRARLARDSSAFLPAAKRLRC